VRNGHSISLWSRGMCVQTPVTFDPGLQDQQENSPATVCLSRQKKCHKGEYDVLPYADSPQSIRHMTCACDRHNVCSS